VGIVLEQHDHSDLIRLEGVIDIESAAELKSILLQALGSGRAVHLTVESATHLDITALQLLWAAERDARTSGSALVREGQVPASVSAALNAAGFAVFPVPAHTVVEPGLDGAAS